MRLNIRSKIILISVAIFFLSIGANTWVNGLYFAEEYSAARQSEAFVITQTLKSQLDRLLKMHIPIDQLVGFEEMCQDILTEHTFISYAMVVSPDGTILFHSDPARQGQKITNASLLKSIGSARQVAQTAFMHGEDFFNFFIPVSGSQNEPIACVATGFPVTIITGKTKNLALYSIGITLISFTLGLVFLIVSLNQWVGKPIRQFIDAIQDIKQRGPDATQRVEIKANDEIGELALAFNQMTAELRETTVSKDYMDNVIENMLNSLIVINTENTIQSVNQESLNLLGYQEAELIGKSIYKILVKSQEPMEATVNIQDILEPVKAVEAVYLSKSGREIPVLFSSSVMQDKDHNIQGSICVAQDITEIKTLQGFIPICAACKKIRDDTGFWNQVESYLSKHSKAEFSHSICPECAETLYPGLNVHNPK